MSKLHLLNEINTVVKMASGTVDETRLAHYLDDLLSNYEVKAKEEEAHLADNEDYIHMFLSSIKIENYSEKA